MSIHARASGRKWGWCLALLGACFPAHAADYFLGRSSFDAQREPTLTPQRVYDGSTAAKVDAFFRKVPEASVIHLTAGIFETHGVWDNYLSNQTNGFRLRSGWTIAGAGTNSVSGTIVRLIDVPVEKTGMYNFNAVFSTGAIGLYIPEQPLDRRPNANNITIRDLQIDCNYPGLVRTKGIPGFQVAGVQILGNHGVRLSNLLIRNAASRKLESHGYPVECFQVYVYNHWAPDPPGDYYLDHITIADYQGGYTSAICVNGNARGTVQNCTVDLASDNSQRYGINFAAGLNNFTIINNVVRNATRGINNDTGPACTSVQVAGNQLLHCSTGMLLANSQHCSIYNNLITLDGTGSGISIRYHPQMPDNCSGACFVAGNSLAGPGGEGISLCYKNEENLKDTVLYWSSGNIIQSNVFSGPLQNKIPPESLAANTVRPANRRHTASYPACNSRSLPANLAAIGFPSDIGRGAECIYCPARALNSSAGYILRVQLSNTRLDVTSDAGDGSGYTDFTTGYPEGVGANKHHGAYQVRWADLQRGRSYTIGVAGAGLRDPRQAVIRVYVDWDHDGTFDSTGELVASGTGSGSLSTALTVPRNVPLGSTRMRVILAVGRTPGPCESGTYQGEVEDYTVNVVP